MIRRDDPSAAWRKSRHSNGQANCVEVAGRAGSVAVRDSKDPDGPALAFRPGGWTVFVRRLKNA